VSDYRAPEPGLGHLNGNLSGLYFTDRPQTFGARRTLRKKGQNFTNKHILERPVQECKVFITQNLFTL
jgi:hypothetical protein